MKRLLAILLACVLCLSTVFTLVACGEPTPPEGPTVDDALELFTGMYEGNNGDKTQKDYNLPAQLLIDGVKFPVTYTVDNQGITITLNETTGFYVVDIPDENAEEVTYTITATIADADGNTKTYNMTRVLAVYEKAIEAVTELTEETAYKIFLDQKAIGKVLFVTAEASGTQYLKTNIDPKAAPDFFVELVDGGIKVYTEVAGTKMYMYLTAAPRKDEDGNLVEGKFDKAIALSAENASVLKYNAEINAWYTDIVTNPEAEVPTVIGFAAGTYGDYDTLCISETSYFTAENTGVSQFPMQFILKADGEAMAPTEGPADPTEVTPLADVIAIGAAKEHNTYTVEKYLVVGKITSIASTSYGNMYIEDEEGNSIYIYGLYSADGETKYGDMDAADQPQVGDTIKVMSIVGQYNDTVQLKNARLIERTAKEWTDAEKVAFEKDALTVNNAIHVAGTVKLPAVGATHPTVTIAWAIVGTTDVATLEGNTITVAALPAAETTFKVKATLTCGTETAEKEFTITVDAQPQTVPQAVENPVAGTAYKLMYFHTVNGQYFYFNGTAGDYYGNMTANQEESVDVYREDATGGYYIYFLDAENDNAKTYIEAYMSGTYCNIKLTTETPASVWTDHADHKVPVVTLGENAYFLGTYGDKTDLRPSKISYIEDGNYVADFYVFVDLNSVTDEQKVAEEKDLVTAPAGEILTAGTVTLDNVASKFSDVVITWALKTASDYATISGNVLTVTLPESEAATVTLVATLTLGEETATKEFTITIQPAELPVSTIAEALAAEQGTTMRVSGTVVAVNTKGFLIKDATGTMLVYLNKAPTDVTIGDVVTVEGALGNYKANQFTADATVTKTGTTTVDHGTPTVVDGAAIDAYLATGTANGGKIGSGYVKLVGTLAKSSNYYNLTVEGAANGMASLTYPAASTDDFDGKKVEVYGYLLYTSNSNTCVNIIVTSIAEYQPSDAELVAAEKEALTVTETPVDAVGDTITLPAATTAGVTVTWAIETNDYVTLAGNVLTVAALPTANTELTVTATITKDEASDTREFTVTVSAHVITDAEKVATEKGALTVTQPDAMASATLPTAGTTHTDVTIAWAISGEAGNCTLADNKLTIVPAATATSFKLVATITSGTESDTKEFDITVNAYETISLTEFAEKANAGEANWYFIEGVIASFKSTSYGNVYIVDAEGNSLYVYGIYDFAGTKYGDMTGAKPVAGQKVVLYSKTATYSNAPQAGNSKLISFTSEVTDAEKVAVEKYNAAVKVNDNTATLSTTGATFTDVAVVWTIATDELGVAAIENNTLTITPTTSSTTVTLKATFTLNQATAEANVTINVAAALAEGVTQKTYTFSDYTAGSQYAEDEAHELDDVVTVTTTKCHFTTQLRIYSSSTYDGYAVISSTKAITDISVNAGNKADTINVYGSNDGGATWTLVGTITTTSTAYNDYSVVKNSDWAAEGYTQLKLDVAGTQQVRLASMTLSLKD